MGKQWKQTCIDDPHPETCIMTQPQVSLAVFQLPGFTEPSIGVTGLPPQRSWYQMLSD